MNNKKPLVSVLICSYNAEKFIESTAYSVLNQTYTNIEVLILDNASADTTVKLLESIQKTDKRLIMVASKENHGPYHGLNILLGKAKGVYIAINDHDDIWHSEKLERQIRFLEEHSEFIASGTGMVSWYEKYQKGIVRTQPQEYIVAWHTSLVYRNEGFRYDLTKTVGTDFYFMKNILCKGTRKIYNFKYPYVFRRIWKDQHNLSSQWMKKERIENILRLNVPFFDKIALLNRKLLPHSLIEWVLLNIIYSHSKVDSSSLKKDALLREFGKFIIAEPVSI